MRQTPSLLQSQILPEKLLVVSQLDHQRNIEYILEPPEKCKHTSKLEEGEEQLREDERNKMAQMQSIRGRPASSVEIEWSLRFVGIQNQVEIAEKAV